jgi:hypothetical protein
MIRNLMERSLVAWVSTLVIGVALASDTAQPASAPAAKVRTYYVAADEVPGIMLPAASTK